jgi:hypothetical protein
LWGVASCTECLLGIAASQFDERSCVHRVGCGDAGRRARASRLDRGTQGRCGERCAYGWGFGRNAR